MLRRDRWPGVCLAPSPASPSVRVITTTAIPSQVQPGEDRGGEPGQAGAGAGGRYTVSGSGSGLLLLLTARTTIRPPIGVARQKMTSQNI